MNALNPMLVTLSGMVIEVKLVAPLNAESPMLSNKEASCDIVTEDKLVASLNA